KFGNIAINKLLEKMYQLGSSKNNIVAKVFGGANVIETNNVQFMIGDRNIAIAAEMLHELQIQIVSQSVGGNLGRKIQYNTATAEVKQRIIEKQHNLNGIMVTQGESTGK
ncbi:MAG TPA: chemotaxis protein CheD, partial [Bacteroidales bacterium]|nr:chemotaxis protein CheD [Bacteroidales bacterium]